MPIRVVVVSIALLFCLFLSLNGPAPVIADTTPPVVLCDTEFDPDEIRLPDPFPGVYYYYELEAWQAEIGFPLKRIDQHGTTALDGPLIPNLPQWNIPTHISPDGRFMVFEPRYYDPDEVIPNLIVWRIGTEETASILMSDEEFRSLVNDHLPFYRQRARLTWQGSDRLLLRFFDVRGFPDVLHLVAETEFVLTEDPLMLTRDAHTTITYPEYPPPPEYFRGGYERSPQGNYTFFVAHRNHIPELGSGGNSYQVYDTHTDELLFERISSPEIGVPVMELLWTEDEQTFYYQRRLPVGTSPYFGAHTELFEVDVSAGFIESDHIQRAVEEALETSTLIGFNPVLSDDDDLLAFNVVSSLDREYWIAIYKRSTEELTLICNPFGFLDFGMIYPFWPPGGDHFAYWNAVNVPMFDINTGELYQVPSRAFIDWVEAISVLTADAGPDQTVTAVEAAPFQIRESTFSRSHRQPSMRVSTICILNISPQGSTC
jgi:hypothetical protein